MLLYVYYLTHANVLLPSSKKDTTLTTTTSMTCSLSLNLGVTQNLRFFEFFEFLIFIFWQAPIIKFRTFVLFLWRKKVEIYFFKIFEFPRAKLIFVIFLFWPKYFKKEKILKISLLTIKAISLINVKAKSSKNFISDRLVPR